nr:MFS transporter [Bacteroidia bacterium]
LMGTWFLANAAANKLAGTLSALIPPTGTAEGVALEFPKLLGFQITNLYEFFMIFIIMSGAAALILLLIYKRLLKMMHGVN